MQANSEIDTTTTKMAIGIIAPSRACRPRAVKDRQRRPASMGLALGRQRRGGLRRAAGASQVVIDRGGDLLIHAKHLSGAARGGKIGLSHRPQSSSASRFTAGAAGFFILSQSGERPER